MALAASSGGKRRTSFTAAEASRGHLIGCCMLHSVELKRPSLIQAYCWSNSCKICSREVLRSHFVLSCFLLQPTSSRYANIDLKTQEAYELAVKGLIRPMDKSPPLITSIRCLQFAPPKFQLGTAGAVCYMLKGSHLQSFPKKTMPLNYIVALGPKDQACRGKLGGGGGVCVM